MRKKGQTLTVFNTSQLPGSTSGSGTSIPVVGGGGVAGGGSPGNIEEILNSFYGAIKKELMNYLRKDKNDRSVGKIASDVGFEVGEYVSGASGAIIYKDMENGQTVAEMDKLYVRMKAYFETLEIINVNTVGGKQILSPAGSIKCVGVEETDNAYRCYFLAEQDGEKIENRWMQGDQAYSQIFNAKVGVSNKVSNTYYWRLVTEATVDAVDFEGKQCHYIDLSKTDCDKGSDIPKTGDIINQRGSRTDVDRMNFIEQSSVDAFSPNITLFHGVNSYSLAGKEYVSYGVDKSTNKAFMNVYGEMYVGDRQGGSYMRYTQENGLEISGTLSVGTKLGDKDLQELINSATPEGYQEFVEKVTQDIEGLQNQIDGAIESYFFQYNPTLDNYPAMEWIANSTEKAHLNDTFTNLTSGYSWRWSLDGTTYKWVEITDTATTKALAMAGKAQDTADGKRRVFVDTPKPPYDKGDLWSRGSDYPLMICVNPKAKNQTYEVSDFDYADNNAKLKEEMQDLVNDTKDDLNNAIGQATEAANKYADQGISAAEQAINTSINALNQAKANVSDVYSKAEADGKISESETKAINAAKAQADAAIALSEITIKAYADGIVDEEEAARIKQAQENLEAAKKYADEAAQAVEDEINNNYGYLSQALNKAPQTEVNQGLVLTSLIQMRNTSSSIMSGLNGLYGTKKEKSIATWWGGDMHDLEDYYSWNGTEWVVKSNVTVPTNIPSGLIRFDGTGYLAKGKFWWDNEGKIYADPTALFLMFDVEDEAQSLSSTILAMRDKQAEFESMWSIKTDANGKKYLYSTFDLVTQGGISMYTNAEGLNLPSIYNGLPIDGNTIYWEKGVLKAKGGSGIVGATTLGGLSNVGTWADSVADVDRIMYQAAGSSNWVAKSLSSIGGVSGDYLPLSGGTVSGDLFVSNSYGGLILSNTSKGHNGFLIYSGNSEWIVTDNGWNNAFRVLHDGNFSSYALPLTGGKLSSSDSPLIIERTDHNSPYVAFMYNNSFVGGIGVLEGDTAFYNPSVSSWQKIWHSGNFTPSNYLPLSGGTLETSDYHILTLRRDTAYTQAGVSLNFANKNGDICHIYAAEDTRCLYRGVVDGYKIWDEGNDGSGSGLDADLLDGLESGAFLHYAGLWNNANSASGRSALSTTYWADGQTGYLSTYGTSLNFIGADGMWHNSFACRVDGYIDFYQGINTTTMARIGTLAYTWSNVASATKLQTARIIWGQSFDGTGNVSGALYNVDAVIIKDSYGIYQGNVFTGALGESDLVYNANVHWFNGNVGIGTTSPSAKLHVSGQIYAYISSDTYRPEFVCNKGGVYWSGIGYNGVSNCLEFGSATFANGVLEWANVDSDTWKFRGNILATGGITFYSQRSLKNVIDERGLSLSELSTIKPTRYTWKDNRDNRLHIGGIADDIQQVLPEVVYKTGDNVLTMDYGNAAFAIASSLIKPVIDHERRIEMLERENKELKKELAYVKRELESN